VEERKKILCIRRGMKKTDDWGICAGKRAEWDGGVDA
jgi:hypothetical protein